MERHPKLVSASPPPLVEEEFIMPKPADWFTKLISLQADIIYNCLVSLSSPIFSLFSVASESYHRAEEATTNVENALHDAPSNVTYGTTILLRKIRLGLVGAVQVCMVLVLVMVLAAVIGVGLVQLWVEEPVFVRERLFFDYTDVNPKAFFCFSTDGNYKKRKHMGVPVGHTFHVSLLLLMPESDFNRQIGVFQLNAELLSTNGDVIAKSSQPCMLRFRSLPIRVVRTFIMGIPLLLGISSETQMMFIDMLKHKEGNPRTESIKVTLIPRAGTSYLPQLYEAEIIMNSQLPWTKQLVHNWKWTLYVWTSLYVYIMFLIILLCCFKPLFFQVTTAAAAESFDDGSRARDLTAELESEEEQKGRSSRDEGDISDLIRKWKRSRSERKAVFLRRAFPETVGSSASSMSVTREDISEVVEEDIGDSESVCLGG